MIRHVVHWPAATRPQGQGRGVDKYLTLQLPVHAANRLSESQCDFWEPYFFRSSVEPCRRTSTSGRSAAGRVSRRANGESSFVCDVSYAGAAPEGVVGVGKTSRSPANGESHDVQTVVQLRVEQAAVNQRKQWVRRCGHHLAPVCSVVKPHPQPHLILLVQGRDVLDDECSRSLARKRLRDPAL